MISPQTRRAFQESYVYFVLREIKQDFEDAGVRYQEVDTVPGERRSLVEGYYSTVNWESPKDVRQILNVFEAHLLRLEDVGETERHKKLVARLERDGFLYENRRIVSVRPMGGMLDILNEISSIDVSQMRVHINRMNDSVESDPSLAIGTAKDLVEACCKAILKQAEVDFSNTEKIPQLVNKTAQTLKLLPQGIPQKTKGETAIKSVLGSLAHIVHGMAELRNLYGSGHGREPGVSGLSPRHARLAAGAATAVSLFFAETAEARKAGKN